ncbi:hypothetical protein [uncultured Dokdonia sp.]|uniref:hypothetical protein n=1 Tax=uncultured Dokdonia sp. TaxID=575653 RepID=UPI00262AF39E|nr:hypothetical protein [uncultured Dokdonia sp.]
MMKKDDIEQLFDRLEGQLSAAEPSTDHQSRFLEKLQSIQPVQEKPVRKLNWWKPLAVAASIALVFMITLSRNVDTDVRELADVSPEMEQTQQFFTQTIEKELFEINEQATPETQAVIDDAKKRLATLEADYDNLKSDLAESGQDKRVIYAMISNFQNRIDLLQQVLEHIDAIKNLNELKASTL